MTTSAASAFRIRVADMAERRMRPHRNTREASPPKRDAGGFTKSARVFDSRIHADPLARVMQRYLGTKRGR